MTLGLDTDVIVSWAMSGAEHHEAARTLLRREVRQAGHTLACTPQVLFEFIHVVTDPRRFERPMSMAKALDTARDFWDAPETIRVLPGPLVMHRTLELLGELKLGRKRILDTALAATFHQAGVTRLATLNGADYKVFRFLEIVDPREPSPSRAAETRAAAATDEEE